MKAINIGLIWANPYNGNLGVSALSYSSLYLLEKISRQINVKFNYTILDGSGPANDILEIGEYKIKITNSSWDYTGSFRSVIKFALYKWYQIIQVYSLNVIFDMGEGDSFSDIYGIERFRKINGSKKIFSFLGKKVVLLPQTLGPFTSSEAKKGGLKSILKAYLALTRDKQSFDYITKLLPQKKIYELIDVAFFMPFKPNKIQNQKVKIGINISGLLWNGGYTKNNQFKLKTDYKELMIRVINYFLDDNENEVYLIAHVIAKDYNKLENDLKVCHEVNKRYPNTIVAPTFTNPIEAKSFISGLDFFTGARMHACIAAFSTGVPVFPLAYSRKFNGLFGDTLNYKYYGDLVASNIDDVQNNLKSAFHNRNELREILRTAQNSLLQKEADLLNLLSNAIQSK